MSSWPMPIAMKQVEYRFNLALPEVEMATHSIEEYKKLLVKRGWYLNNTGANSDVYLKQVCTFKEEPKCRMVALKISVNDYGYDLFLEKVLQHQNNPHFPKVYEVKRYLSSIQRKPYVPVRVTLVAMEALADSDETERHSNRFQRMAVSMQTGLYSNLFQNVTSEELHASRIISDLFEELGSYDLHSNNVMMRRTQPVIIDPVVYLYNDDLGYLHDDA